MSYKVTDKATAKGILLKNEDTDMMYLSFNEGADLVNMEDILSSFLGKEISISISTNEELI